MTYDVPMLFLVGQTTSFMFGPKPLTDMGIDKFDEDYQVNWTYMDSSVEGEW